MSISVAPFDTLSAASAAFVVAACAPEGNPATVHNATLEPSVAPGNGSNDGEMHTAATFHSTASRHNASTSARVASGVSSVWSM